ncbi:MAG TPA: hypothetical protein VKE69_04300 [Planctomycetota bacterium]|nr:hypothetical protein [Planctomycetota bacterium]
MSDVIGVGRVERLVSVRADPTSAETSSSNGWFTGVGRREARFADVRVMKVLKGDVSDARALYFADRTWTCDDTTAIEGEEALFFLRRGDPTGAGERYWTRAVCDALGDREWFWVSSSGQGRMPIRRLGGTEYAEFAEFVQTPSDLPLFEGGTDWSRIATLESLESLIAKYRREQRAPFLEATCAASSNGLGWTLSVALDRSATLTTLDRTGRIERSFVVPWHRSFAVERTFESQGWATLPPAFGPSDAPAERVLRVFGEHEKLLTLRTSKLTGRTDDDELKRALRIWIRIRDTFDDPTAADLREADRRAIGDKATAR